MLNERDIVQVGWVETKFTVNAVDGSLLSLRNLIIVWAQSLTLHFIILSRNDSRRSKSVKFRVLSKLQSIDRGCDMKIGRNVTLRIRNVEIDKLAYIVTVSPDRYVRILFRKIHDSSPVRKIKNVTTLTVRHEEVTRSMQTNEFGSAFQQLLNWVKTILSIALMHTSERRLRIATIVQHLTSRRAGTQTLTRIADRTIIGGYTLAKFGVLSFGRCQIKKGHVGHLLSTTQFYHEMRNF